MASSDAASRRLATLAAHLSVDDKHLEASVCAASSSQQYVKGQVEMDTLAMERAKGTFPIREMTYFLDGSRRMTEIKEMIATQLERDPIFNNVDDVDCSRDVIRERTMARIARTKHYSAQDLTPEQREARELVIGIYDPSLDVRMGVHHHLFKGAVQGQGSDEQRRQFVDKCNKLEVTGCFCMTEVGHGSAIRDFETTATFDRETDEFVIHSPTQTSKKIWIGGAAHTATHTVVFARLIVDGTDHGVQSFIVQMRDESGILKTGISVLDCGKKMGRDGIDNGLVSFTFVRIPRTNMLSRFAQVTREGKFIPPPIPQLAYGALIGGRVSIINRAASTAMLTLTIALRYGLIRRQFAAVEDGPQQQIIDYPTHQARLFPFLASSFAMHFAGVALKKVYTSVLADLEQKNLSGLADLHALSACLKAYLSWHVHENLETARQTLGGHGYSAYNRLPTLIAEWAIHQTWEGDNTVLAQQTGRYLLGCLKKVMQGGQVPGSASYLNSLPQFINPSSPKSRCSATCVEDFLKPEVQMDAFIFRVSSTLAAAGRQFTGNMKAGKSDNDAWNESVMDFMAATKSHSYVYMLRCFMDAIATAPSTLQPILKSLCDVFAIHSLINDSTALLESGYLSASHMAMLRGLLRNLYTQELRPNCAALVDSFNMSDFLVNAAFGVSSGDIYTNYLHRIASAPGASKTSPSPYWNDLIRPMLSLPKQ